MAFIVINSNALHPLNADEPIEVTPCGISMLFREEHPINDHLPMLVKEEGKVTDFRLVQPLQNKLFINVTPSGIIRVARFMQL